MSDSDQTILLVDDEERDLEVIVAVLESAGYQVCRAASYTDAVQCMQKIPNMPDLSVTDIALPQVNGVELYCKLAEMTGV